MRLNLEFPEERIGELKSLMAAIGVDTYKDLMNNALTLLEWSVSEVSTGRSIASIDERENKYRELAMPIFDKAKKSALRRATTT